MNYEVVEECTKLSDEGKISFPEVVGKLAKEGIEMYYSDLLVPSKTYYQNEEAYVIKSEITFEKKVNDSFDNQKVIEAIRLIQSGDIQYQEFLRRIMEAGVISYMVFINGKKVVYFGKLGEQHVELFPTK